MGNLALRVQKEQIYGQEQKKSWRIGAMTEEIPRNGASFFFFNTSYQGAGNPSVVQERE